VLGVERGQIRLLDRFRAQVLETVLDHQDDERAEILVAALGIDVTPATRLEVPTSVVPNAFSLAIAQQCNLGCTYCYAEQGTFGAKPSLMVDQVVMGAIDQLLSNRSPGDRLTLAFMGGEPLTNRQGLHNATRYAQCRADAAGVEIQFALTTNATLVQEVDLALFQQHAFTITVSLDGPKWVNDLTRPLKSGRSSHDAATAGLRRLIDLKERRYRVSARATVTPSHLDVVGIVDALLVLGFDSVRLSPLLSAPSASDEMDGEALDIFLESMLNCAKIFELRLRERQIYPFENVLSTLRRIHAYQPDAYPCGAGGGYLGVSAEGGLFACHRFVDRPDGRLGDVRTGVDPGLQRDWLAKRHLDEQSPCTTCWARYLCNGSCHHEVITRGRPACDYIRGWLHEMLGLYARIRQDPVLFERALNAIRRLH
jgi:uncharacterized protein